MTKTMPMFLALVWAAVAGAEPTPAAAPLKVGVTLHPYYSWTSNVTRGTDVEVRPILPGEIDGYPKNLTQASIEAAGLSDEQLKNELKVDHRWVSLKWSAQRLIEHTRFHYGQLSHQQETNIWKGLLRIELNTASADSAAKHYLNAKEEA